MVWQIVAIVSGAVLVAAFLFYIYRFEPFNFGLTDVRINVDTGIRGDKKILTILHLSDFHLRRSFKGRRLFEFVRTLADGEYDFIFITGDMVEATKNIGYLTSMLSPFRAGYGKYAILGVHDHYQKAFHEFAKNMFKRKRKYGLKNDTAELAAKLKKIGIEVLRNESRVIKTGYDGAGEIEIIGLDDPVIEKLDFRQAFSGIDRIEDGEIIDESSYREVKGEVFEIDRRCVHRLNREGRLRLALLHTPDSYALSTLYMKDVDIVFSGHTHGGQVRLPLLGALISGCRLKTRFASGLFYFKKMALFISRGLGEGKYTQFRCLCPPEAVRITVYSTGGNVENF
jgi:uncharacterized protein